MGWLPLFNSKIQLKLIKDNWKKKKNHKINTKCVMTLRKKKLYFQEDRLIRILEISSKKFVDLISKTDLSTQSLNNWGNWCPKYQNRQRRLEVYLTDPIYACFTMRVTFLTHFFFFFFLLCICNQFAPKNLG